MIFLNSSNNEDKVITSIEKYFIKLFSDANPFLNIFDPLFRTLTRDGIS